MRGQSIHYALDVCEQQVFVELRSDAARFSFLEIIMRGRKRAWWEWTDKAWEAIHRCLAGGTFDYRVRTPLHRCVLSGKNLYKKPSQAWYIGYTAPEEVKETAEALGPITERWMRERYWAIDPEAYGMELSEADFKYTWGWFRPLRAFFKRAAKDGRAVVFKGELH
jgi:hypothetical protein